MRWLLRLLLVLLVLGVLAAGAAGVWWWRWQNQPLALPAQSEPVPLHIKPGSSGRQVANALHQAGVELPVDLIVLWLRQSGKAHLVKAGYYEMEPGLTPSQLLDRLVKGEQALVVDALTDADLRVIGEAAAGLTLITGGSGIALGLPENFRRAGRLRSSGAAPGPGSRGRCSNGARRRCSHRSGRNPPAARR